MQRETVLACSHKNGHHWRLILRLAVCLWVCLPSARDARDDKIILGRRRRSEREKEKLICFSLEGGNVLCTYTGNYDTDKLGKRKLPKLAKSEIPSCPLMPRARHLNLCAPLATDSNGKTDGETEACGVICQWTFSWSGKAKQLPTWSPSIHFMLSQFFT